ncbi:MAG: hypothetical protein AAF267_04150 [Deinococcota bacterium]
MNLRLDPWAAEYNTAFFAETNEADASTPDGTTIDAGIEQPADAWQAARPQQLALPPGWQDLFFLDGSRRVEARVLLEQDRQQLAFGVLGTYGVGAVSCCASFSRRAEFVEALEIARICALSDGYTRVADDDALELAANAPVQIGNLKYRIVATDQKDADAVVKKLQDEMRHAEQNLAAKLAGEHPNALIICDGPRPINSKHDSVLGYVKTIHNIRINAQQLAVVQRLEQGERSPLYVVKTARPEQQYFEWFVRLRDPRPWLYSLAGIVRLQAYAGPDPDGRLKDVINLANWLTLTLPKLASRQHQDPRAPQQLLPIRALEAELHRRMGNHAVVRRRITRYLSGRDSS